MAYIEGKPPSLAWRLTEHKRRLETELDQIGPGPARDNLLEKLRHLDVATRVNAWLSSPGLRQPM
jgi:hypothetical protein